MKRRVIVFAQLTALLLVGCAVSPGRLVIARVQGPVTAKGPIGDVVWTNEAGFLIRWNQESRPDFFVYAQTPARIRHTTSFSDFLKMLGEFPAGTRLDWVNTCGAAVSWGMPEENVKQLMTFLAEHHLRLLKPEEGLTTICRCESTNTVWFRAEETGSVDKTPGDVRR